MESARASFGLWKTIIAIYERGVPVLKTTAPEPVSSVINLRMKEFKTVHKVLK